MRQIVLYTDEEGNWIAEVPSLPGTLRRIIRDAGLSVDEFIKLL